MRFEPYAIGACLCIALMGVPAVGSPPIVSDLPPHYIIERLKEVRLGWEVVEIDFVVLQKWYALDPPGSEPRMTYGGRLVLSPSDCGELGAFSVDAKGKPEDDAAGLRVIWASDEVQIHRIREHVQKFPRSELPEHNRNVLARIAGKADVRNQPSQETRLNRDSTAECLAHLGDALFRCLLDRIQECREPVWRQLWPPMLVLPESPKYCLPLVFADDVDVLSQRFELSVMEDDKHLFLIAHPLQLCDKRSIRETAICIDRETFLPIAKRNVSPNGDYVLFFLTSLRANNEEIITPYPHLAKSE